MVFLFLDVENDLKLSLRKKFSFYTKIFHQIFFLKIPLFLKFFFLKNFFSQKTFFFKIPLFLKKNNFFWKFLLFSKKHFFFKIPLFLKNENFANSMFIIYFFHKFHWFWQFCTRKWPINSTCSFFPVVCTKKLDLRSRSFSIAGAHKISTFGLEFSTKNIPRQRLLE